MIRAGLASLAALAAAAPAVAAEGGAIRGGEHVGFSRIVLTVEPTTEWSLETVAGRATVFFPGKAIGFATQGTFEKLPKTRIQAVRAVTGEAGTTIEVDLSCDCRVSTSFVGARYLAVDVADRDLAPPSPAAAAPAAEDPAAREAREASAVASAERVLIRQIERAASQGLIELSEADTEPAEPPAPEAAATPASPATTLPLRSEPAAPSAAGLLARLPEHEQISATTVFDRDGRRAAARQSEEATTPECLPDTALDVGAWSNGLPLHKQAVKLAHGLVGEFDAPNPPALRDLVRLHVRFGFGAEAESLLASFDAPLEDRALLADLARAVDGRRAAPDGPLAIPAPCPGRHGLWLALGGVAPVFHDEAHFATVQAAFGELPAEMRALLGPPLIGALLDAGRPGAARLIHDTTARPGQDATAAMRLAEARLVGVEGRPAEAMQAMDELVEANASNAVEALTHLARLALDAGLPIPERLVTDLRAAALQHRGSELEAPLRGLLAEALARQGALGAAVDEIRAARADLPASAGDIDALAVRLLAAADPGAVGAAAYAATMLEAGDLIAPVRGNDAARRVIASRLIGLGLPNAALAMLAPAAARGDTMARLAAADAELRLGRGEAAQAVLGDLGGPEAAALRARAFALGGDFRAASTALDAIGRSDGAAPYAWPAGDWPRARDAAERPDRLAMAAWMAAQDSGAAPPSPSPDPAELAPDAAFREPLPGLVDPSLDAARRLLAAGRQVEGFVDGLLTQAPEDAGPAQ